MMAEEAVILHEALSAKFIQIIVNRLVFGHTLSYSLHSQLVRDFYITELKASFSEFSILHQNSHLRMCATLLSFSMLIE